MTGHPDKPKPTYDFPDWEDVLRSSPKDQGRFGLLTKLQVGRLKLTLGKEIQDPRSPKKTLKYIGPIRDFTFARVATAPIRISVMLPEANVGEVANHLGSNKPTLETKVTFCYLLMDYESEKGWYDLARPDSKSLKGALSHDELGKFVFNLSPEQHTVSGTRYSEFVFAVEPQKAKAKLHFQYPFGSKSVMNWKSDPANK